MPQDPSLRLEHPGFFVTAPRDSTKSPVSQEDGCQIDCGQNGVHVSDDDRVTRISSKIWLHGVITEKITTQIFTFVGNSDQTIVKNSKEMFVPSHSRPTPAVAAYRIGSGCQVFRQCGMFLRLSAVHGALPHKSSSNRHFSWSSCVNSLRVVQPLHRILGKLHCDKCLKIAIAI